MVKVNYLSGFIQKQYRHAVLAVEATREDDATLFRDYSRRRLL